MHLGCVVVVVGQRRVKDIIRWTSVIDLICGRRHVFDVASSERGWRVAKKVTERNNKSALGRITGKYRDRPGLVQLFVACYYRNVELLKKNSFAGFGLVERKWAGSSCCCCRPRFTLIPSPFSSARRGASAVFI